MFFKRKLNIDKKYKTREGVKVTNLFTKNNKIYGIIHWIDGPATMGMWDVYGRASPDKKTFLDLKRV